MERDQEKNARWIIQPERLRLAPRSRPTRDTFTSFRKRWLDGDRDARWAACRLVQHGLNVSLTSWREPKPDDVPGEHRDRYGDAEIWTDRGILTIDFKGHPGWEGRPMPAPEKLLRLVPANTPHKLVPSVVCHVFPDHDQMLFYPTVEWEWWNERKIRLFGGTPDKPLGEWHHVCERREWWNEQDFLGWITAKFTRARFEQ